jgi:hypothetical protein
LEKNSIEICDNISKGLNNKTRKEAQMKFCKHMPVPHLTYEAEISTMTEKQEAKIETAKVKFLRSVAG